METRELKTLYMCNLRAVKNALNKSVAKMAKEMNVSESTLTSYLKGERTTSLEMATHLYQTYNINLGWFCTGEGEMFITAQPSAQDKTELAKVIKETMIELILQYGGEDLMKKLLK